VNESRKRRAEAGRGCRRNKAVFLEILWRLSILLDRSETDRRPEARFESIADQRTNVIFDSDLGKNYHAVPVDLNNVTVAEASICWRCKPKTLLGGGKSQHNYCHNDNQQYAPVLRRAGDQDVLYREYLGDGGPSGGP